MQSGRGVIIDAGGVQVAAGDNVVGRLFGQKAGEIEAVAADVHERAASEFWIEADVALGVFHTEAEAGADQAKLADVT